MIAAGDGCRRRGCLPGEVDKGPPGVCGNPAADTTSGFGGQPTEEILELRLVGHVEQFTCQLDAP